jgi:hypothetical protein
MRVTAVASEYPRVTVHGELEATIFSRAQARSKYCKMFSIEGKLTIGSIHVQVARNANLSSRRRQDVRQPATLEQSVSPRIIKRRVCPGDYVAATAE